MFNRVFVLGLVMGFASLAQAGDLGAPFSLDSAAVLPKGIRNVRITNLTTAVDNQYNTTGNLQPLGASINKTISFKRLTGSIDSLSERAALEGTIEGSGYSLNDSAGQTFGEVNTRVNVTVPVAAYGINEKLMVAVAVPVIYSNLNISTGWIASENTQNILNDLVAGGSAQEILARKSQLENVVRSEITKKGYVAPHDQEKTQIGDMQVIVKRQLMNAPKFATALQGRIVTPTGKRANINDISDVGGGDGQWDMGVGFVADYFVLPRLTLTSSTSYLNQMPGTVAMRIPTASDESLTPDIDYNTEMDLGDTLSQALSARYKATEVISVGLGGAFQYKGPDHFAGSQFEGRRYDYLEIDSEQNMVTATATLGFSTIELFRRGAFIAPVEANFAASRVFAGRNVNANTIGAFELVAFF